MSVGEANGDHVEARLRQRPDTDLVEADLEVLLVDVDAQVAVIVVVVFGEDQLVDLGHRLGPLQIGDVGAGIGLLGRLATTRHDQRIDVVAAVAADDEGHADFLELVERHQARVALVIVGMAGQHGVGIDPDLVTDRVDLRPHFGAAAVIAAGPITLRLG